MAEYRRVQPSKICRIPLLGYDQVEFTHHAVERMRERRISREDVYRTIQNPDMTSLPAEPNRQRVRWNKGQQHAIDVVYELTTAYLRVITAFRVDLTLPQNVAPTIVRIRKKPRTKRDRR